MTLLDAVQIARRFWMTIAACILLSVGAAAYYAAQQPRLFVAGAEAYVTVGGSTQVAEASVGSNVAGAKATAYAPLTKSGLVADRVIGKLGLAAILLKGLYKRSPFGPAGTGVFASDPTGDEPQFKHQIVPEIASVPLIFEPRRPWRFCDKILIQAIRASVLEKAPAVSEPPPWLVCPVIVNDDRFDDFTNFPMRPSSCPHIPQTR